MNKRISGILIVLLIAALSGCSFTDGSPWGEVEGEVGAHSVDSTGTVPSEVQLERATMKARLFIESISTSSGGSGGSFDPSNPPEGYTLCHNGHCHSDEGELVSYEDVRAELNSSGGTSTTTLGRWQTDIDLQSGETNRLPKIAIGQRTSIDRIQVEATNLILEGSVDVDGETVPLEAQLGQFDVGAIEDLGLQIGPDGPFKRTLRLCASWPNKWFDQIDFSQLEKQEGTIKLTRILNSDATTKLIDAVKLAEFQRSNCQ